MNLKLSQYVTLMELFSKLPTEGTTTEIYVEHPETCDKIIQAVSDADISEMSASQKVGFLEVIGESVNIPKPTIAPAFFVIDGVFYHPPAPLEGFDNTGKEYSVTFGQLNFGDTLEGMRLQELMKGNYKMLPYILAYVYKEENPEPVDARAKKFLELDASDAYSAYFFLTSTLAGYTKSILSQQAETIAHQNTRKQPKWQGKNKPQPSGGTTALGQPAEESKQTILSKLNQHMRSLRTYFTGTSTTESNT